MARLLFWGAQGIKRNLAAAVDYYREGAEANDPTSQYNYGLVLLRVGIITGWHRISLEVGTIYH